MTIALEGGFAPIPALTAPRSLMLDGCDVELAGMAMRGMHAAAEHHEAIPGRYDRRYWRLSWYASADDAEPAWQACVDEFALPELAALWQRLGPSGVA